MAGTPLVSEHVAAAVDAWLLRLPKWEPPTHRGRARICRRCVGSPILVAAGIPNDTPHQVSHALVARMQRIIDAEVDAYTEQHLPTLHAEFTHAEMWKPGGYDPAAGLEPEYDGLDLDPEVDEPGQPFLFTMTELAAATAPEPALPRPPLTAEEKRQLRAEIADADRCADETGQAVCFALMGHRGRIHAAIERFVEPKIQFLLQELSKHLESPK